MRSVISGVAVLILGMSGAAACAAQPAYREIKDWIAACDNGSACQAQAIPEDTASMPEDAGLQLFRAAGPSGEVRIELAWGDQGALPMRLDGKPLPAYGWSKPDKDGVRQLGGPGALELVRRLRDGSTLTIGAGPEPYQVSLKGLAAVLLFMDEAQGRLGNQSALARPGPAPATATPAPPPLPVLHPTPPAPPLTNPDALVAAVRKAQAGVLDEEGCEEDARAEDGAEPLTRTEAVVIVTCIVGAYQASSLVFRVPREAPAKARLVELPLPPGEPADASERKGFLTSGSYDPKSATLGEWAKGRGLADCGVGAGWIFDGQAFQLADFSVKNRCGGRPGDWLTLWRTRTAGEH